ncbi:hypothetical protein Ddc_18712 [Ditylenchus destructor]|nr:hypothetical protein Ddc_18712 [Ditylenchus destructor]
MPDFLGDHLIFILVIVCALVPQTTSSVESDAKNLMSEISSMTSSTLDVADRFNLITSKAAAITKLLGPIGTMVATSAEIVLQPQTDEMKAINILSKEMKAEFLGLNQKVAKHSEMFSFELALRDYKGRVELVLNSIEYELEDLINPEYDMRQQYVKPWKDDCESKTHSPLEVLKVSSRGVY